MYHAVHVVITVYGHGVRGTEGGRGYAADMPEGNRAEGFPGKKRNRSLGPGKSTRSFRFIDDCLKGSI